MEVFHEASTGGALDLAGLTLGLSLRLLVLAALIGRLEPAGAPANGVHPHWAVVYELVVVFEEAEDMDGGAVEAVTALVPTSISSAHL